MSPPLLRIVLIIDDTVLLPIAWLPSHVALQPPPESANEIMYDLRPVSFMYCWIGIGLLNGMMYSARLRLTDPGGAVGPTVGVGPAVVGVGVEPPPQAVAGPQGWPLPDAPLLVQGSLPCVQKAEV